MRQELIFNLNRLADELEEKAKAYRAVANDLNGQSVDRRLETYERKVGRPRKIIAPVTMKGKKYKPGTHWMQKPENRARLMKTIRKMHRARHRK